MQNENIIQNVIDNFVCNNTVLLSGKIYFIGLGNKS